MLYNLKKLSEEERYERHMLIQKFVTFDPYFQYLPQVTSPTNNHKKYSNKDLAAMYAAITQGVPEGREAERLRKLYQQFCLQYDDMRNRHFIQMGAIPRALSRGTSGDNRPAEERQERREEEISLPRYQKRTSSYRERHRTYHEEQFDDTIEFETQTDLQQFQAFSDKYGLKISAKLNKLPDDSQQQKEPKSSKKKQTKYVQKAPKKQIKLPMESSQIPELRKDKGKVSVNSFELNVQYSLIETEINNNVSFQYEWPGRLPNQIYKISLKNEQLTIQGNGQSVSFTVPRYASDSTFLSFSQQKDRVVRATIGWESYQGKYKLNHTMELPFQGFGHLPNEGVYFSYDQDQKKWIIASRPFANEQEEKQKEEEEKEEEEKEKQVDREVRGLIEDSQPGNSIQQARVQQLIVNTPSEQIYYSFLKQVSHSDKSKISNRISLLYMLFSQKFDYASFVKAWKRCLKYLYDKQDALPYLASTLAKILHILLEKQGSIHDFFDKDEENQEIKDFTNSIFQRYYWYSKDEEVKILVKIRNNKKFNDLV